MGGVNDVRYIWHGTQRNSIELLTVATGERIEVSSTVDADGERYLYEAVVDPDWVFRSLEVTAPERRSLRLRRDSNGCWFANEEPRPDLAAAVDIDLAFSPFTNTLPIRRLTLTVGSSAEIVTAYVDAPSLHVTPDPQRYTRVAADQYLYESLDSDFSRRITVDADGFVLDYPGLFSAGGTTGQAAH